MIRKFYFIELPRGSKMNNDFYVFLMNLGVGYNLVSKSDMVAYEMVIDLASKSDTVAYEMVIDDVTVDLINSYVRFWNKHYADDEFMPELESMLIEWLY